MGKNDHLITAIKSAINRNNEEEARYLLKVALKEPNAEIYYLASLVALNEQQRQSFLNKALAIDPGISSREQPETIVPPPSKPVLEKEASQINQERAYLVESGLPISWVPPIILFIISATAGYAQGNETTYGFIFWVLLILLVLNIYYAWKKPNTRFRQVWIDSAVVAISFSIFYEIAFRGGDVQWYQLPILIILFGIPGNIILWVGKRISRRKAQR